MSQIGGRVDEPQLAHLRLRLAEGQPARVVAPRAEELARAELAGIQSLWRGLLEGRLGIGRWPLRRAT